MVLTSLVSSVWCLMLITASVIMLGTSPVGATSMLYKKNDQQKYEQDLVAVSSTVIPLTVYEASAGLAGDSDKFYNNEEYKLAYLKHLQKKQQLRTADGGTGAAVSGADRLITGT